MSNVPSGAPSGSKIAICGVFRETSSVTIAETSTTPPTCCGRGETTIAEIVGGTASTATKELAAEATLLEVSRAQTTNAYEPRIVGTKFASWRAELALNDIVKLFTKAPCGSRTLTATDARKESWSCAQRVTGVPTCCGEGSAPTARIEGAVVSRARTWSSTAAQLPDWSSI